uniref:Uncharacterized protein n=1 Tax=Rhizophora mucronata TaxID=61149 RepID=A0A2P2IKN7_RHIMU
MSSGACLCSPIIRVVSCIIVYDCGLHMLVFALIKHAREIILALITLLKGANQHMALFIALIILISITGQKTLD